MSLSRYNLAKISQGIKFVGLSNYISFLTSDNFWHSFGITAQFTVEAVIIEVVLGFFIAILLNSPFRGKRFVRTAILIPLMTSQVATSALFVTLLNDQFGLISNLIRALGVHPPNFLADPKIIMHVMVGMDIWQQVPFVFIIALAGLQSVPPELYESGRVDGANGWHMLWHITLPLMKPIINIIVLIRLMDAFRVFDRIWMLTKGGPGIATTVLTVYSYRQTFENFNVGAGSAISWVIFIIVAAMSGIYSKISSRYQN